MLTQAQGPTIGTQLTHYRLTEVLGSGGMGVVFRSYDERLERDVAIKVLAPDLLADPSTRKRFRREAVMLSKLNHPHIAAVYDFDSDEGADFLVMEFVPGVTLDARLTSGSLAEPEVIGLGKQLAFALAAAHALGLVHRDLKPGNLRITPGGQLKVLDFGLAVIPHSMSDNAETNSDPTSGFPEGTLPYMAPEQLRGDPIDVRTDLYAAGAVLYEMATGVRALSQQQPALLIDAILNRQPVPPRAINPRISEALQATILKALAKQPERRHQSARELQLDLEAIGERARVTAKDDRLRVSPRQKLAAVAASLVRLFALPVGPGAWSRD